MVLDDVTGARRRGLEDLCDNVVKRDDVALYCRWVADGVRGLGNVVVTVVSTTPLLPTLPLPFPPTPPAVPAPSPPAVAPAPPRPPLAPAPLL